MSPAERLLVIDDEPDLRTLYELTLLRDGHDVLSAGTVAEALGLLADERFTAVITDMRLPDGTGLDVLAWLERQNRTERAIVITAHGSAENAVEALKAGAFDYLTKPVDLRQFRSVVATAIGRDGPARPSRREGPAPARVGGTALDRLAGDSPAMTQVRELIRKVSRSMAPVLLQGESGTGKEVVARAIHGEGARASQPFVAVNCGAIPEALLEAEFFGYRKGAFTGANEDREGFFQAAQGGTLFLDEIGDLPLAMQSKLLRAIQERCVRPVGAVAEVPVNLRILSATHKDLAAEVAAGRFRQDLYYRLNVIQIRVPPLRERLSDLSAISAALLARIAHDAGVSPIPRLSAGALARLQGYAFPGNVRELENVLHRALALSGATELQADDLDLPDGVSGDDSGFGVLAPAQVVTPASPAPGEEPLPSDLQHYLDEVERRVLQRALAACRFNRTAAGARLGLSLRQMRYRMARLGIQVDDAESSA
ncbi:sigma-54-dependent transcriptional regulator [Inhella gelatinilytica]|uniref:Sigma-54-dependent Fis family transcriptional regulator n=1 Tax=Inhella gelatinilytica TaxID=2795030 RepID=A0A931NEC8_9BURK|nr:sigma-54 dependent transcriptional regulator [Inhella gelatinilytica]MBH9552381.1 sigma-54-dependent Fis family transcriptional regulator [Inhella gelatinilytica]